ncbi:hypothetical protein V6N11_039305 [Hibiscus sabdariffa]|uniref:FAD-dependent oxidoreductase 2 FAD-binding domain-containing protein n=1 Tax=Hibiscus sabdariffa TaxID=183260 RepID=A0ABR2SNG4_9ROSI
MLRVRTHTSLDLLMGKCMNQITWSLQALIGSKAANSRIVVVTGGDDFHKPSYTIVDHTYNVVVVSVDGAGLKSTIDLLEHEFNITCTTKLFLTCLHTVATHGGINVASRNMTENDFQRNMYDTVKGREWLGDQDKGQYRCMEAPKVVIELKNYVMQFFRTKDGKIYQQAFGGQVYRYAFVADQTRHALVHTLLGQGRRYNAQFFVEYFVSDMLMNSDGSCHGVIALNMKDGTLHRFQVANTILVTGEYGACFKDVSRSMTMKIGNGRGVRPLKDHIYLQVNHFTLEVLNERLIAAIDYKKETFEMLKETSFRFQLLKETFDISANSKQYSHQKALTEVLLKASSGITNAKVERREEHQGFLDTYCLYWSRMVMILDLFVN